MLFFNLNLSNIRVSTSIGKGDEEMHITSEFAQLIWKKWKKLFSKI